jgi:hypothetical protein
VSDGREERETRIEKEKRKDREDQVNRDDKDEFIEGCYAVRQTRETKAISL